MRPTRSLGAIVVAGIATISAVGCGDDGDQITKPEFIERADAVCREAQDELEAAFDAMWEDFEGADEDDPTVQDRMLVAFDETIESVLPQMHEMADELRDLGAPAGDEDLLSQLFDDLDAALDEFATMTDAAVAGDEAARAYIDGEGGEAAIDVVNRRAQDYGLDACGAGS